VTDEAAPDKDHDEPKNAPNDDGSSEGDDDPKQGLTLKKIFRDQRGSDER
jgi:hypothetical protein